MTPATYVPCFGRVRPVSSVAPWSEGSPGTPPSNAVRPASAGPRSVSVSTPESMTHTPAAPRGGAGVFERNVALAAVACGVPGPSAFAQAPGAPVAPTAATAAAADTHFAT